MAKDNVISITTLISKQCKPAKEERVPISANYPVHNLNSIIMTGLVIVLQCIKLVLDSFFCTKL
jgi:hypothetical protein